MPNWCVGYVKFRGTLEDLKRFIENEFEQSEPEINDEELIPYIENKNTFLKSLVRTYVECDDVAEANDEIFCNDNGVGIFAIKLCHAWNVVRQGYEELAKEYNLDIKGKCYERGLEFIEEFEYDSNGDEIIYNVHKFGDYQWECECPTLGG